LIDFVFILLYGVSNLADFLVKNLFIIFTVYYKRYNRDLSIFSLIDLIITIRIVYIQITGLYLALKNLQLQFLKKISGESVF